MALTLVDLDFAFENMWLHKNQIPALLDTWHELLNEFLETMDDTPTGQSEVKSRIHYWEAVLSQRNTLNNPYYETTTLH